MKYYIESGDHEVVLQADSADQAVQTFLRRIDEKDDFELGTLIKVSEVGFGLKGKRHNNDILYSAEDEMEKMGWKVKKAKK